MATYANTVHQKQTLLDWINYAVTVIGVSIAILSGVRNDPGLPTSATLGLSIASAVLGIVSTALKAMQQIFAQQQKLEENAKAQAATEFAGALAEAMKYAGVRTGNEIREVIKKKRSDTVAALPKTLVAGNNTKAVNLNQALLTAICVALVFVGAVVAILGSVGNLKGLPKSATMGLSITSAVLGAISALLGIIQQIVSPHKKVVANAKAQAVDAFAASLTEQVTTLVNAHPHAPGVVGLAKMDAAVVTNTAITDAIANQLNSSLGALNRAKRRKGRTVG